MQFFFNLQIKKKVCKMLSHYKLLMFRRRMKSILISKNKNEEEEEEEISFYWLYFTS